MAGEIMMQSDDVGWLVGGPNRKSVFRTDDGGQTWNRAEVGLPTGGNLYDPAFGLPTFFESSKTLILPYTRGGESLGHVGFLTSPDGHAWRRQPPVQVDGPVEAGTVLPTAVATGKHWFIARRMGRRRSRLRLPSRATEPSSSSYRTRRAGRRGCPRRTSPRSGYCSATPAGRPSASPGWCSSPGCTSLNAPELIEEAALWWFTYEMMARLAPTDEDG